MVSTAYSAALSGMQAASLQLKISANNISNSNTDGFQTQRVVTQAGTYGVDVKVEKIGTSESQNTLDSNAEKSVNQRSNVNVVEELIEMKAAKNLLEAKDFQRLVKTKCLFCEQHLYLQYQMRGQVQRIPFLEQVLKLIQIPYPLPYLSLIHI